MMRNFNNFIVAAYIRLSQEDVKDNYELLNKKSESESVTNQKSLLLKYIKDNNYILYDLYIDDGYTGTNFDRPAFKRMIEDIKAGKVNMVVTKDLSRLGRDYIGTGEYVEKWFPEHNVRYVSLLDGVDTFLDNSNNEIAPFKAIINDMYSRDNSKKIRAALHSMQAEGKWVGGCTPMGYMQDPNCKNKLIINEDEAVIVKRIFSLAGQGFSTYKIRELFNEEKVPTFQILRGRKPGNTKVACHGVWNVKTIDGILKNRLYTGDMVQNRRSRISYKVRKVVPNSKENWVIVENTHEPIVDKNEFERVQKLIKCNTVRSTKKIIRIFDGLLFCYECKHRITVSSPRKSDNRTYMACNYYRMYSKLKVCTSHGFNYDKLEKEILEQCSKIFENYLNKDFIKGKLIEKGHKLSNYENLKINITKLENELRKKLENVDKMYLDKLDGKISEEMFLRVNNKLSAEIKDIETKIELLSSQLSNCDLNDDENEAKCNKLIKDFLEVNEPTRDMMMKLIKRIEVHDDKTVDIYFNFKKLNFFNS